MVPSMDIDAYLSRINYTGPRTPTYETLAGVLRAHIANIPFESFDVLLGRPIRLDTEGGRINIMNQGVQTISHGVAEPSQLGDRRELRSLVARHFGFDLPELETMRVDAV